MRRTLALVVWLSLLPAAAGAAEAALATGPDLKADGWRVKGVLGRYLSEFIGHGDDGMELIADEAAGFVVRQLTVDDLPGLTLHWSWRLDKAPPPTDLAAKDADDRPLAVHVWFPGPPDKPGDFGHVVGRMVLGLPRAGRVLSYVWGGADAKRRIYPNPYIDVGIDGVSIVLRPGNGPTGQWFEESVDIYADFLTTFGEEPPLPTYIVLSADTDSKGGRSEGWIKDICFSTK